MAASTPCRNLCKRRRRRGFWRPNCTNDPATTAVESLFLALMGGCKFTARVPTGEGGGYLPALSLPPLGAFARRCFRRAPYLSFGPLSKPSASSIMSRPSSEGLGGSDFQRKANEWLRGSIDPALPMRPAHALATISHGSHNGRSGLNPQVAATCGHERHGQQGPSNRLRRRASHPLATEAAGYRATPRASKSGPTKPQ